MAFPPRTWFSGQLATAAQLNADVRDNLLTLNGGGVVPVGLIALWGAAASLIPAGWGLCDGGGGRLDLRDVFPIGAGNLYAVGATGGAATVTPAAHATHVVTQPAHAAHVVGGGSAHATTFVGPQTSGAQGWSDGTQAAHSGQAVTGSHTHSGGALDAHSAHAAMGTLPPYHARAFMQKATSGLSFTTPRTWTTGDVPTAAQFNADLRDNFNYLLALVVPQAAILMWGNSIATIPTGWQICDGSNGTPDLRDKFVIGAGGSYVVGATGGALTGSIAAHAAHTPTPPADHADHTVTQPSGHGSMAFAFSPGPVALVAVTHSGFAVTSHPTHAGFSVSGHGSTGHQVSGGAIPILPPYFAEAFIQLLSVPTPTTPRTWTTGDTVQANQFNTYIRDNENAILAAQFPIYGVAIWSSSIASIPANYLIVQPDVMYIGAGNLYAVSASGGATSTPLDSHPDHTVNQPNAHSNHTVTQPSNHTSSGNPPLGAGINPTFINASGTLSHNLTVDAHDAHAFTVDPHSAHAAISTLPPYKAVAFMERFT